MGSRDMYDFRMSGSFPNSYSARVCKQPESPAPRLAKVVNNQPYLHRDSTLSNARIRTVTPEGNPGRPRSLLRPFSYRGRPPARSGLTVDSK
jgi:hypothetical protein